jgi:hypothetical protein
LIDRQGDKLPMVFSLRNGSNLRAKGISYRSMMCRCMYMTVVVVMYMYRGENIVTFPERLAAQKNK